MGIRDRLKEVGKRKVEDIKRGVDTQKRYQDWKARKKNPNLHYVLKGKGKEVSKTDAELFESWEKRDIKRSTERREKLKRVASSVASSMEKEFSKPPSRGGGKSRSLDDQFSLSGNRSGSSSSLEKQFGLSSSINNAWEEKPKRRKKKKAVRKRKKTTRRRKR